MASANGARTQQQLGDYICHANPYTKKPDPSAALPTPMDLRLAEAEVDDQSGLGHMTVDTCGKPDLPTLLTMQ
jgi:hypothetical protein